MRENFASLIKPIVFMSSYKPAQGVCKPWPCYPNVSRTNLHSEIFLRNIRKNITTAVHTTLLNNAREKEQLEGDFTKRPTHLCSTIRPMAHEL
jgi:HSP90 family molecular chaperone